MKLGLIFTGGGTTVRDLTVLAQRAEDAGCSTLCMAEAWRSGFVPLTAMAAATTTIALGPYVLNAYGRSPLLAGMAAIDFNEFSGGRLKLGVGGGNRVINETWQGIAHDRVLTKMHEYVELMQQMARTRLGETLVYEGRIHRMEWSPAVDPGAQPYPVILAAVFPAMLRVAARVADGIGGGATLSAEYLREVLQPRAAASASEADRDPDTLTWSAVGVIAVDDDRDRARRAAREAICHFYAPLPHPYYEYTMREQGFAATADALLKLMPAGRLEEAVAAIPDECIDRLVIAGTPTDCRARLAEYHGLIDEMILLNVMPPIDGDVGASYDGLFGLVAAA